MIWLPKTESFLARRRIGFTNLYIADSIDFGILFDIHVWWFAPNWFCRILVWKIPGRGWSSKTGSISDWFDDLHRQSFLIEAMVWLGESCSWCWLLCWIVWFALVLLLEKPPFFCEKPCMKNRFWKYWWFSYYESNNLAHRLSWMHYFCWFLQWLCCVV